ncbi:hypothetical protein Niako_1775 [Niastella koreensis GR20-10]|uniref:Uncharacterized protein n=1 Tax=Niastella koreensis (strain DSM 17620 / KACC 11465 / NBRC 106392 / GR20-10) TaxID=700598 RepID=G8TAH6_NIAKG|nr:hypothetical protein Niako_1775 [Niastella koreensis GR20-10]
MPCGGVRLLSLVNSKLQGTCAVPNQFNLWITSILLYFTMDITVQY